MSSADTPSTSTSRGARFGRRVVPVIAVLLAMAALATGWLLRDPVPLFAAHTGALAQVETLEVRTDSGVHAEVVRLTSATGLAVTLAIRSPVIESTDVTRRQLFLILGGHERGKGSAQLIGDTRGTVFASMDYPYEGNQRARGLAVLAQIPAIRRAFYATPPAVTLALDHLLARADVDPARVELVGASFGVPFATIAAARDARVTRLWLAHGGGKPWAMIDTGLVREIPWAPLRRPVSGLATLLASGPRLAPELWIGQVAPRPVVMLNAMDDERIPRRSVDALWAATTAPKEMVWIPGRHVQGNRPEVLRALIDSVMARAVIPDSAGR